MSVPHNYLGVWKRTLLRTPDFEDTTTEVYWIQTLDYHADIRVPANRPAELARLEPSAMTRDQLLLLADQQGFAGNTVVEDDICRWHRRYDFQPPSGFNDVGRMSFESEHRVFEYGIEQDYFEIWDRLPDSVGGTATIDITPPGATTPTWLLRAGAYVMRVTPRPMQLERAANLRTAAARVDDATLRHWLNFEISFGKMIDKELWRVVRSSMPHVEGSEAHWPQGDTKPIQQ